MFSRSRLLFFPVVRAFRDHSSKLPHLLGPIFHIFDVAILFLKRFRGGNFLGAGGPTNHWVARFSYTPWRFIRQYHVRPQHVQVSTDEHIKISPSEPSEVASCTNLVGFWRPYFWDDASLHVPMSKLPILGMVIPPLIGILVMGI